MSIRVARLKAPDLQKLLNKKARTYVGSALSQAQEESLEHSKHCYTIFRDDEPLLCGGVVEYWKNRGESWAVLDPECRQYFVEIHSIVKRFLDLCPVTRIEAAVDVDFSSGQRWVRALGFQYETKLRKFLPDGQDVFFYSRVRED